MNYRGIAILAILLAAAAGSWLLGGRRAGPVPGDAVIESAHEGYYVLDARVQGIGSDGRFLYQIDAREIVQNAGDDSIEMIDVRLSYSAAEQVPWTLTAQHGSIDSQQRVLLTGAVRAQSTDESVTAFLVTEELEIDPENFIARTDKRVTIQIGSRSLSATGMLAFLNEDRIELKSNVSGKFLP